MIHCIIFHVEFIFLQFFDGGVSAAHTQNPKFLSLCTLVMLPWRQQRGVIFGRLCIAMFVNSNVC